MRYTASKEIFLKNTHVFLLTNGSSYTEQIFDDVYFDMHVMKHVILSRDKLETETYAEPN